MSDQLDIARLKELCAKATPGPWQDDGNACYIFAGIMMICQIRGWGHLTGIGGLNLPEDKALAVQEANSKFIVSARTELPALIAENERLTTERDELKYRLQAWNDSSSTRVRAGGQVMDYSKLSDRELDALVAERVMGLDVRDVMATPGGRWFAVGMVRDGVWTSDGPPRRYSTDDNAARLMRDRIAELKLVRQYRTYLAMQIWPEDTPYEQFKGADEFAFLFEQATPRQQAIAALQALDAAKENAKHE